MFAINVGPESVAVCSTPSRARSRDDTSHRT